MKFWDLGFGTNEFCLTRDVFDAALTIRPSRVVFRDPFMNAIL